MAAEAIHRWAHRYAGGNWVATGGGGYEWVGVVPRAWTHLLAEASGQPIAPATPIPPAWLERVRHWLGQEGPERMTDGYEPWPKNWSLGHNPADPVDAAVLATRSAVYPYLGLPGDTIAGF
jgi:acetoin utilization protein AcuC